MRLGIGEGLRFRAQWRDTRSLLLTVLTHYSGAPHGNPVATAPVL